MEWTTQTASSASVKLSGREIEVLLLAVEGQSSQNIGEKLFISKRTVEWHLQSIYDKLQVSNRVQACRQAHRLGFLRLV